MKLTSTPANQDAEGVERAFRGSPFGSDTLRALRDETWGGVPPVTFR